MKYIISGNSNQYGTCTVIFAEKVWSDDRAVNELPSWVPRTAVDALLRDRIAMLIITQKVDEPKLARWKVETTKRKIAEGINEMVTYSEWGDDDYNPMDILENQVP